jgi:hypothetical protein
MESESEDEAPKRRSSRNRDNSNERMTRRNRRKEPEVRREGLRNGTRRRADSSIQIQESEMDYSEAVSYKKNNQKEYDEQFEKLITAGPVLVDQNHMRDENFS